MFGVMYVFGDGWFYFSGHVKPKNVRFQFKDLDLV
jgi:hypothetical protein